MAKVKIQLSAEELVQHRIGVLTIESLKSDSKQEKEKLQAIIKELDGILFTMRMNANKYTTALRRN